MQQRIRAAMAKSGTGLLPGIVEADETYIGRRPRKANKVADRDNTQIPTREGAAPTRRPLSGL